MRHTKVKVIPIWRIHLQDGLYYFVAGTTKRAIMETIKRSLDEVLWLGKPIKIEQVSPDDYNKILLQTEPDDEESFTTLYEEAKYYVEHNMNKDFFIASSFDVIIDATI